MNDSRPVIRVAVAVVRKGARWLVARRPADAHLGNLWEFPGGKCEPEETALDAALRELEEECGIRAHAERALPELRCAYADRIVLLTPVICSWSEGDAAPLHSQECAWVTLAELRRLDMPEANEAIIRELALYV